MIVDNIFNPFQANNPIDNYHWAFSVYLVLLSALPTLSHLFLKVSFNFKGTNHSHFNIKPESQGDDDSLKAMVDQWNRSGSKKSGKETGMSLDSAEGRLGWEMLRGWPAGRLWVNTWASPATLTLSTEMNHMAFRDRTRHTVVFKLIVLFPSVGPHKITSLGYIPVCLG